MGHRRHSMQTNIQWQSFKTSEGPNTAQHRVCQHEYEYEYEYKSRSIRIPSPFALRLSFRKKQKRNTDLLLKYSSSTFTAFTISPRQNRECKDRTKQNFIIRKHTEYDPEKTNLSERDREKWKWRERAISSSAKITKKSKRNCFFFCGLQLLGVSAIGRCSDRLSRSVK